MALIPTGQVPDDYRRKLAYKLMMEGTDASPVQHWAQGLARMGQGALGGYEMYQADQKDKETEAGNNSALVAALQAYGGGAPAASAPSPQPTPQQPTAQPTAPVSSVTPSAGAVPAALSGARPGGPVMPSNKVWGDAEAEAAGIYEKPAAGPKIAANGPVALPPQPAAPMVPTPVKTEAIAPAPAAPDPQRQAAVARLAEMLRSDNPQMRKVGSSMAQQFLQGEMARQFKPTEWDFKQSHDGSYIAINKANPSNVQVVPNSGGGQGAIKFEADKAAAVEGAKKGATAQAEAKGELPASAAKRDTAIETIAKVRNHPGRGDFGAAGTTAAAANMMPGTKAYDFKVAVDQLKGQSFLQAYEALKGGGAIANAEGAKAEAAIARLDRAQTPAAFDEALTDYQTAIERGFAAMEQKAGVAQQPAQSGGAVIWERGPDGKPRRKQ